MLAEPDVVPALEPSGLFGALPARLGRYELQSTIASGMMGVVCRAWDPLLGRSVALKIPRLDFPIRADERELLERRFLLEASLAAALSHPHIVVVHDVGRDPETHTPFIALEYLEGRTLDELASQLVFDWREALRLTATLALALHHAHAHGVIHRDVKPSNIMVLRSGEPKILDFGIARPAAGQLTAAGESWGTPSYMSPEQAMANPLDGRSDLFSLGAVLYELLTGRRAFGSDGVARVMARVTREEPPRPSSVNPALPSEIDTIVARALAKDPGERYADGQAFAEDAVDVLQDRPVRVRSGLRDGKQSGPRQADAQALGSSRAYACTPTMQIPNCPRGPRPVSPLRAWGRVAALCGALVVGLMRLPADSGQIPAASAQGPASGRELWKAFEHWTQVPRANAVPLPQGAPLRTAAALDPALLVAPSAELVTALRPAHVALAVEHAYRRAQLKVWVDGTLALDRRLVGAEARKLLVLRRLKGTLTEVLEVPAGEHRFRVSVVADGTRASAESRATLASDETRMLQLKLGSKVELEWKR